MPEFLGGNADKGKQKGAGDGPGDDKAADGNDEFLESWETENAVVHEQDAQLRPAHVPDVDDLGDQEKSRYIGDGDGTNCLGVVSNAPGVHDESDGDDDPIPELQRGVSQSVSPSVSRLEDRSGAVLMALRVPWTATRPTIRYVPWKRQSYSRPTTAAAF